MVSLLEITSGKTTVQGDFTQNWIIVICAGGPDCETAGLITVCSKPFSSNESESGFGIIQG
ncbi:hypothetical protein EV199_3960 [Pseudobacter ginsenosidimutans]|uniref:Uncharacterized protein n=1 Tax=Pseudobacter ginsenosidimutans TaxID=661488 RepID=A0A4Q7MT92_9BACT|nr:hypothetical protein EV199_3960 [Pseudobacter ginsenosidimutans]